MPKDYYLDFLRFLGRTRLFGEQRTLVLARRNALLAHGFETIDTFPMWVVIDTPDGQNVVFANVFTDPPTVRLFWKHPEQANINDAVYVLGRCVEAQVVAYFPFEPCGTNIEGE